MFVEKNFFLVDCSGGLAFDSILNVLDWEKSFSERNTSSLQSLVGLGSQIKTYFGAQLRKDVWPY